MCTVSWIHTPDGYELFCNRDERLARKAALPPQILDVRETKAIAPRDGDFGGSWISVNEFGLSLCLLNLYEAPLRAGEFTSRGLLLMDFADSASPEYLIARLPEVSLHEFRPFTLLALAVGKPTLIVRWNGSGCGFDRDGESQMPLTSSSFDTARVVESRKHHFRHLSAKATEIDSGLLSRFHRSHEPSRGAYSTCMHRADAETVSFTQIAVDSNLIQFRYHPHSPCRDGKAEIKTLQRTK